MRFVINKMHPAIHKNIEILKNLCEKYEVNTMYVFGSACTNQFNENSDIDILISFKDISVEKYTDNYFALHNKLQGIFKRKVDLITEKSLSNPFFIQELNEKKILLYAA